jgi:hypothetical protein
MAEEKMIPVEEISKHNTPEDCWIVVEGKIWDITEFAPEHPGGGQSRHSHVDCIHMLKRSSNMEARWPRRHNILLLHPRSLHPAQ